MEQVVLVDKQDRQLGFMDKLEAHQDGGTLHRAISVLLYRDGKKGKEVLLQKRSKKKPLWPRYWADTTSTHPRDGESYEDCTVRRLQEEMGIIVKPEDLRLVFKLVYSAKYNEELSEREVDGILVGRWDGEPKLNMDEAEDFRWVNWEALPKKIKGKSDGYAPWLELMVKDVRLDKAFKEN